MTAGAEGPETEESLQIARRSLATLPSHVNLQSKGNSEIIDLLCSLFVAGLSASSPAITGTALSPDRPVQKQGLWSGFFRGELWTESSHFLERIAAQNARIIEQNEGILRLLALRVAG